MLYVGFFAPFKESLFEYVLPLTATYAIPVGILFLLFSLPLLCVFLYVWKTAFRQTKNNFIKFLFFLCATAPLIFLPAAIVANDWDRYWAAAVNTQFILLFYFLYAKEPAVTAAVKKVGGFFKHAFYRPCGNPFIIKLPDLSQAATNIFSFIRIPMPSPSLWRHTLIPMSMVFPQHCFHRAFCSHRTRRQSCSSPFYSHLHRNPVWS